MRASPMMWRSGSRSAKPCPASTDASGMALARTQAIASCMTESPHGDVVVPRRSGWTGAAVPSCYVGNRWAAPRRCPSGCSSGCSSVRSHRRSHRGGPAARARSWLSHWNRGGGSCALGLRRTAAWRSGARWRSCIRKRMQQQLLREQACGVIRVALVFFSIGFVVSTIEEAAGRGYPEGPRSAHGQAALHGASVVRGGEEASGSLRKAFPSHGVPRDACSIQPRGGGRRRAGGRGGRGGGRSIELPASMAELRGLAPPKKWLSEPDAVPVSRIPVPNWMSRAADPLAAMPDLESAEKGAPLVQEFIMPFENGRVTSLFNQGRRHPAIDLAGPPRHAGACHDRAAARDLHGLEGRLRQYRDDPGRAGPRASVWAPAQRHDEGGRDAGAGPEARPARQHGPLDGAARAL